MIGNGWKNILTGLALRPSRLFSCQSAKKSPPTRWLQLWLKIFFSNIMSPNQPAEEILKSIRHKDESFWLRLRQSRPLALFHAAAVRVPAYKDFLRQHKIDH